MSEYFGQNERLTIVRIYWLNEYTNNAGVSPLYRLEGLLLLHFVVSLDLSGFLEKGFIIICIKLIQTMIWMKLFRCYLLKLYISYQVLKIIW